MSESKWGRWLASIGAPRRLARLLQDWRAPREYQDTLRRLLKGDFQDLEPDARREKVDQIVQISASAAMALAAAPIPFLDMPVQAAMVRAIAKVHGVRGNSAKVFLQIVAGVGGGMVVRQALRLVPFGGIAHLSRVYGTTWALGRVSDLYFQHGTPVAEGELRALFLETLERKYEEKSQRLQSSDLAGRLRELDQLWSDGQLTEQEHRAKREQLIASL